MSFFGKNEAALWPRYCIFPNTQWKYRYSLSVTASVLLWYILCVLLNNSQIMIVKLCNMHCRDSSSKLLEWFFTTWVLIILYFRFQIFISVCSFSQSLMNFWKLSKLGASLFHLQLASLESIHIYRVAPKKVSHHQFFKKIALKIANEIRFLCKVKVWIKHYNTIRW